jgi:RHS repeat-associated protein
MRKNKLQRNSLLFLLGIGIASFCMGQSNLPNGSSRPSATAVSAPATIASGVAVNYVRSREAIAPISDSNVFDTANYLHVKTVTQYVDGLGRPLQSVARQASPSLKDLVAPIVYDALGRESLQYLPYISTESSGNFKLDAFERQATFNTSQYSGESIFYSERRYENSPLNRVVKTLAQGNSWGGQNIGMGTQYLINDANDSVLIWNISPDSLTYLNGDTLTNIPSSSGMYAPGELFETHIIDENNNHVVEYKDREGKVILKKVQIAASPAAGHSGWLCTYYVYDDFGLLRFVIAPKAVEYVFENSWTISAKVAAELCFRYEYDARNRVIAKKVPGAGWVYMVYDRRDRLAYSQDANMRVANKWMSTIYDEQNRTITTGIVSYSSNRGALQWLINSLFDAASATTVAVNFYAPDTLYVNERESGRAIYRAKEKIIFTGDQESEPTSEFETILGAAIVSTTNILMNYNPLPPGSTLTALTVNYYDDYSFTGKTYNTTNNSKLDAGGNRFPETLPSSASLLTYGMLTGTKIRVIENPDSLNKGNWIESVRFYDDKGRTLQSQTQNQTNGNDVITMRYDFTNRLITTYEVHNNAVAAQTVKTKTNLTYDHVGRMLSMQKTLNDTESTMRYLARNQYDELSQLKSKRLGQTSPDTSTTMELQAFDYNIRGWLRGINKAYSDSTGTNAWFGMELNYDFGFSNNQSKGNIAGSQWRTKGDNKRRAMGYAYDAANRICKGDFSQYTGGSWNTNGGLDFSLSGMLYDANGNILKMNQKGWKVSGSDFIDSLAYTYNTNSNKLLNVIDRVNDTATKLGDFRSSKAYMTTLGNVKTNSANDYSYDANGNLILDNNKDISAIVYNHLNLPYQVSVTGRGTITYSYDADGNKLEKKVQPSGAGPATKTSYLGGYVYQNDTLQFMAHEEGRIRKKADNSFVYDYFIKDHLGNTRMVLTEEYQQDTYPVATLEDGATATENSYYNINNGNIVDTSQAHGFHSALGSGYANNNGNPPYNTNPSSVVTATSTKLYRLNGSTGDKTGLGITLKVMSGDTISIYGRSYWHNNGGSPSNTYNVVVNDLLAALAGTGPIAGSGKNATAVALAGSAYVPSELTNFLGTAPSPGTGPKAYINWVLFDEQFRIVTASSGFHKVGAGDVIDNFAGTGAVNIAANGYLYVYCSNESNITVFFDNLQVVHNRGHLLEETHYYPFGLTMAGISSKAAGKLENKTNKFQGQEYNDDLGVDLYEFKYRMDDPQTGRFWQVDPLADKYVYNSTYAFSENKVTGHVELEGLEAVPAGTPQGYLYNAFSSMSQALGRAIDKINVFKSEGEVHFNNEEKVSVKGGNAESSATVPLTENKVSFTLGSFEDFFKGGKVPMNIAFENNSLNKGEQKNAVTAVIEGIKIEASQKTTVDNDGVKSTVSVGPKVSFESGKAKLEGSAQFFVSSQMSGSTAGQQTVGVKLAADATFVNKQSTILQGTSTNQTKAGASFSWTYKFPF